MKIVKCRFSIATQFVKSEYAKEVDVEIEDDASESEKEETIKEMYREWLSENNYGGWAILSEEAEPDED